MNKSAKWSRKMGKWGRSNKVLAGGAVK